MAPPAHPCGRGPGSLPWCPVRWLRQEQGLCHAPGSLHGPAGTCGGRREVRTPPGSPHPGPTRRGGAVGRRLAATVAVGGGGAWPFPAAPHGAPPAVTSFASGICSLPAAGGFGSRPALPRGAVSSTASPGSPGTGRASPAPRTPRGDPTARGQLGDTLGCGAGTLGPGHHPLWGSQEMSAMTFPVLLVGFALFHALHEGCFMLLLSCTPNTAGAGMLPPSPEPPSSSTVRVPGVAQPPCRARGSPQPSLQLCKSSRTKP